MSSGRRFHQRRTRGVAFIFSSAVAVSKAEVCQSGGYARPGRSAPCSFRSQYLSLPQLGV